MCLGILKEEFIDKGSEINWYLEVDIHCSSNFIKSTSKIKFSDIKREE